MNKSIKKDIEKKKKTDLHFKTKKTNKEKNYQVADEKGLYLNVKKNGTKLWEMRFTSPTTKKRRLTSFGSYPSTSLSTARVKRDEYIELISKGIDPNDNKKKANKISLLEINGMCKNVVIEWLDKEAKRTKKSTQKAKNRVFLNDVLPFIGTKNIKDVDTDDIVKIVEQKQIQSPEIASRLFNYLDNMFRYAILKKYCERNILADIRKSDLVPPRQIKHYPKITDEKILKELINAIYNYKGNYSTRNVLKLVLHLPLRCDNITKITWSQINFHKKTLTIPRGNMKLKNINLDDFTLPLTAEAINILKEQQNIQTKYTELKEYVFLGTDNNKSICKESPNRALERLGFNDEERARKIRMHGFRGTFRSLIDTKTKNTFSYEAKEKILDHTTQNKVVLAYNHKADYIEEMKEILDWWSNFICSLKDKEK